jgi:hypothetical protein
MDEVEKELEGRGRMAEKNLVKEKGNADVEWQAKKLTRCLVALNGDLAV